MQEEGKRYELGLGEDRVAASSLDAAPHHLIGGRIVNDATSIKFRVHEDLPIGEIGGRERLGIDIEAVFEIRTVAISHVAPEAIWRDGKHGRRNLCIIVCVSIGI